MTSSNPPTAAELIADPVGRYPMATVACFDPTRGELPRRQLDEGRTQTYLERLASAGAQGLLIASSTGQGHLRTAEELAQWFRCAGRAAVGPAMRVGLLRPEDGLSITSRLMDLLCEHGYPVVFLRPGTDLPQDASDAQVAESLVPFVAAAAERGLAIGLYSISDVSGVALTPGTAARLLKEPGGDHVVAVKVTERDYQASTHAFLAHSALRHLKIVQGWDPHLVRALRDGPHFDTRGRQRAGVTSGVMAFAVHQYLYLLEAAHSGDWAVAEVALAGATRLFEAMQDDPARFADLQRAKFVMGLGHPLTGEVTVRQAQRVLEALDKVARREDRRRLARSLDLMGEGPFHDRLAAVS